MAFDDLPLQTPDRGTSPAGPRRPSPTRWIVLAAAAVAAISILALWWLSRVEPGTAPTPPATASDAAARSNRPKQQPLDLPTVDGSDGMVREMVAQLSKHPLLARLLASTTGLVRAGTLAVVQIGDGKTPAVPLGALRPASRLQIQGTTSGAVDPASYVRWEGAATALVSVTPADAAQLYVNLKDLFDQAYRDLGHPQGDFDEAIVRAIRVLQATPEITAPPVLLQRPGYFEYEDPSLRALQPVQKQLLLLGPENRRRVLAWLRQFAINLDLAL
jgi:hypothetical protein